MSYRRNRLAHQTGKIDARAEHNPHGPGRGVFGGGYLAPGHHDTIDYISIPSESDASDFGDLTVARYAPGACSNSTRGVFGGGYTGSASNVIDYILLASESDASDFGDLTVA
ncbi:MAG TPA: hypothetical protein DG761_01165, partial [Gammaproteobacteria bacterium]|nr:hypothetical protein [Gammaproteobacteria bacterium]